MKKFRGENEKDTDTALQRLNRPTLNKTRATAAQTFEVVRDLVRHKWVVMEGSQLLPVSLLAPSFRITSSSR